MCLFVCIGLRVLVCACLSVCVGLCVFVCVCCALCVCVLIYKNSLGIKFAVLMFNSHLY